MAWAISSWTASRPAPARSAGEVEAYFGTSLCGVVAGSLGGGDGPSEIRDLISGCVLREG
jgi:L-threonylcarbamoyladenylate synthase